MATSYLTPGIYVEEVSGGAKPIEAVSTQTAILVGIAPKADAFVYTPQACNSWEDFRRDFCTEDSKGTPLAWAVYGFFGNGGSRCYILNVGTGGTLQGDARKGTGLGVLESYDEPAMIAAPGYTAIADYRSLIDFAEKQGIIAILDGPERIADMKELTDAGTADAAPAEGDGKPKPPKPVGKKPPESNFAACYFPWLVMVDPFDPARRVNVPPSGHMAGLYGLNDSKRGVHKAPANYSVATAIGLTQRISRSEQGVLNPAGINCIRFFADSGIRVWGARTLARDPEWRYVNVRRWFNMCERSIMSGTGWCVFEPNDVCTRASIIRDCREFLKLQKASGALVGASYEQAFFVKCDAENNPPEVVNAGRLIIDIGVAPSKPAEFVIFRIGQWAGGTEVKAA
jgi:Bacteriophage tail sheath protein